MSTTIIRSARFSRCRRFRYTLHREWDEGETVTIVGLNPSTADERQDDPTVRRCIRFAQSWGFARLILVNLFAYRVTDPSGLQRVDDPIGPSNDRIIREVTREANLIVVAWGSRGSLLRRDEQVLRWLSHPHCLGTTRMGFPRHPLYLPGHTEPQPFVQS